MSNENKEIQDKLNDWKCRRKKLEFQAREIEKNLFDSDRELSISLDKIIQIMILSARAIEIEICEGELKEIFKKNIDFIKSV